MTQERSHRDQGADRKKSHPGLPELTGGRVMVAVLLFNSLIRAVLDCLSGRVAILLGQSWDHPLSADSS